MEKLKAFIKKYIVPLISLVLSAFLGRFRTPTMPKWISVSDEVWTFMMITLYALIGCLIPLIVIKILTNDNLKAEYCLRHDGKMRGLWKGDGLEKQLKNCSQKSETIRIKVTRGTDLLEGDKKYGFKKIFEQLNGKSELDRKVIVQALLIIPCFEEKHVQARYKTHKKQDPDITEDVFLETWYRFLKAASEYKQKLNIIVKFYFGNHSKWRFYIFSPPEDGNTPDEQIILFSDYDENRDGRTTPMYKVIKQDRNIGGFMVRYFNEIWEESLTPKELQEAIGKGLIEPKSHYSKKCSCNGCTYNATCKRLVKEYGEYMKQM